LTSWTISGTNRQRGQPGLLAGFAGQGKIGEMAGEMGRKTEPINYLILFSGEPFGSPELDELD
jgi:hypothetical protein